MNKDRELIQKALDALEDFCEHGAILRPIEVRDLLRSRLEQPEQDGECNVCSGNGCEYCDARFLNDELIQCTPIPPKDDSGWTEWQFPIHKGYLMQCCDCGLVHEVDFKVVEKVGRTKKDGSWESEPTKKGKFRVGMKMRRYE